MLCNRFSDKMLVIRLSNIIFCSRVSFFFFLLFSFTLVFHVSFYYRFRGMKSEKDQEPGCCNYDCDHFCFSYLSMCLYSVPLSIPLFLCRFIFIHAQRIYNFIYNVHYKKGNIGVQYASVVFFLCLFVCMCILFMATLPFIRIGICI